ncbi:hypothetical protein [Paenibacillus sp. LPE1-1-1.1]|uniref:hypothetical protein n=1 Tax=Paenibacillus sp. LPE1-1-1.1 TaxID=3135230 RepID=UPI003437A32F
MLGSDYMKRTLGILAATIAVCLVFGAGIISFYITDKQTHKFILPKKLYGFG